MIKYAVFLLILASAYYALTYGKSLWVDDQNKLGAVGAGFIAMISVILPVIFVMLRN